jgi:predicted deacetylase
MNKINMIKEVSYGALTLFIFFIIIMLYFSKFNGEMPVLPSIATNETQVIPTGYVPSNVIVINNASCTLAWPAQRTIILRMDDVQSFGWARVAINITDTVLQRNKSIVLGVIPGRLVERQNGINQMADYLEGKISDERIEIAVHGLNHVENEFNTTEEDAYTMVEESINEIENSLHKIPVTFIPPNNVFNPESEKSLSKLGIYIISSDQDIFRYENGVYDIGYTVATKHSDLTELSPVWDVVDACSRALDLRNICVIMIHPQDYVGEDGVVINNTRYANFIDLLNRLDGLNATYTTFNKMLVCQNAGATAQLVV